MIKCPSCGGEKFELHIVGGLKMIKESPELIDIAKYHTCVECEYVIAQPSDLNLIEVTVYVLGNSLSKQRQGLSKMAVDDGLDLDDREEREQSLKLFGYFEIPISNIWVFTKDVWNNYQAKPAFPLAEGQHSVIVKELY